ncbi:MAG: flavodoxin family protein [Pontiella sp.]|nr:flavodoxin family protein [Pontiella sp.]MBT8046509.1 flavodoxin family protein [Pontiella sp.]
MNVLIVYSSRTANTRKVAEAIHVALPDADICPVFRAPDPSGYDLVFAGFWVEKGSACEEMATYLQKVGDQPVALFATLGAYPDSQHAAESLQAAADLVTSGSVVDRFICQGAIDRSIIEWMEQLPEGHENAPTESRRKLWKDAETHPDESDLKNAAEWAAGVLASV